MSENIFVFSDNRSAGSVAIPYHLEEYVGAEKISAIQLNEVQANMALADANFLILDLKN